MRLRFALALALIVSTTLFAAALDEYTPTDLTVQQIVQKANAARGHRIGQVAVPDDASIGGLRDYDGIIGRNVLLRYVVYLDYGDRIAFLKPND